MVSPNRAKRWSKRDRSGQKVEAKRTVLAADGWHEADIVGFVLAAAADALCDHKQSVRKDAAT